MSSRSRLPACPRITSVLLPVLLAALVSSPTGGQTTAPATQPTTSTSTSTDRLQRINDLLGLIEGNNSLQARQIGVRELLLADWPETPERLAAILSGGNNSAKVAVALTLAEDPTRLDPRYISPLMSSLSSDDAALQQATAAALAAYRDSGVVPRLREIVADAERPLTLRRSALSTLGMMTQRDAVAALVEFLDQVPPSLRKPALDALEQATAMDFQGDAAAARAWWSATREMSLSEWHQRQIERLVRQNRDTLRQVRALEVQLTRSLRDGYLRTSDEAESNRLLQTYLADSLPAVRLLGLELAAAQGPEGRPLSAETIATIRASLTDVSREVRAAAVRTITNLRSAEDGERFIQMLAAERDPGVRLALTNGLGYIGGPTAIAPLLAILRESKGEILDEAVTAIGRLAERDVVGAEDRELIVTALLDHLAAAPEEARASRERVLWAAGRLRDRRFAPLFVSASAGDQPVTIRQAAVRGIAALADPTLADSLVSLARDPDVAVRKSAVEALARLGQSEAHLAALWERMALAQEADADVREAAWSGALRLLRGRPAAELVGWAARLPADDPRASDRKLELLQLAAKGLSADPRSVAALSQTQVEIARLHQSAGRAADAVAAYRLALEAAHTAASPEQMQVALGLLRLSLAAGLYDGSVAAALAAANPGVSGDALWAGIQPDIESALNDDRADLAITMLSAFIASPPGTLSPGTQEAAAALLERAQELRAAALAKPPGENISPPTSQPAPSDS